MKQKKVHQRRSSDDERRSPGAISRPASVSAAELSDVEILPTSTGIGGAILPPSATAQTMPSYPMTSMTRCYALHLTDASLALDDVTSSKRGRRKDGVKPEVDVVSDAESDVEFCRC